MLETALALDPASADALEFLTLLAHQRRQKYGIPAAQLIRYQMTGYETADDEAQKLAFAAYAYRTSLAAGHAAAAEAVQRRVRRDFGPEAVERVEDAEGIGLACSFWAVYVVAEACIAMIEAVVAAAVENDAPVPDDVTAAIPDLLSAFDYLPPGAVRAVVLGGPPRLPLTQAAKARYADRLERAMASAGLMIADYLR